MKKFISILLLISFLGLTSTQAEVIEDELVKYLNPDLKIKKIKQNPIEDELLKYIKIEKTEKRNYVSISDVKISPKNYYTTKNKLKEGDWLDFTLIEDAGNFKKGAIVKGRIETISQNGIFGVPADLVIDNFKIDDEAIFGSITKKGANRSLWVYPSYYLLNVFFLAGFGLIPIRGGHAKLKPNEVYIIGE